MREIPRLSFEEFAARYCERQESTPKRLRTILQQQREHFHSDGFMLLECQMLDGCRLGELTILGYGGSHTFKTVPDHPITPRGLASDMSVVVALLDAQELDKNTKIE